MHGRVLAESGRFASQLGKKRPFIEVGLPGRNRPKAVIRPVLTEVSVKVVAA